MVATSRHDTAFNEVNITTYVASEEEESTWGFNVGADVGVFVTDYIGVGGGVIISPGTVGEDKNVAASR